jgi:hypothetical protein
VKRILHLNLHREWFAAVGASVFRQSRSQRASSVANPPSPRGVLPKWNGARVCDPQQHGVPNGRRKFHGFSNG